MRDQSSCKSHDVPTSESAVVPATSKGIEHPEHQRQPGNGLGIRDDEGGPATPAFPWLPEKPGNWLAMNSQRLHLPDFVATKRAAEILGRSPETLKRWRYEGTGPQYVVIEGRVSYDVRVLLEYIKKNTRVPSVRAAMEETREVV